MSSINVFVSIGVLALLIFFHETGHFLASRIQGIRVSGFSIGFRPTLLKKENQDVTSGELNPEAYKGVLSKLTENFGFKKIGITLRESISASDNNWSAIYSDNGDVYIGNKYSIHIVDRVGGGDSFSA